MLEGRNKLLELTNPFNAEISLWGSCILDADYRRALEYFDESEITEQMVLKMKDNPFLYDPILENLQSHDYRKLARVLKEKFSEIKDVVSLGHTSDSEQKENCVILLKGTKEKPLSTVKNTLIKDLKFKHILEFFNYVVSKVGEEGYIILEPTFPVGAKDFINKRCHNVVYHVCPKESTEQILRQGLKCKNGSNIKGRYRIFPKRIYVFALDPEEVNIKSRLKELIEDMFGNNYIHYDILKCKNAIGGNFYKDPAMLDKSAYFTYNTIPAEDIELIKLW